MKKNFTLLLVVVMLVLTVLASCEKPCEHTFSDKWYNDAENHWHPATCEHAETERSEFGAHVDTDENGICDTCEYEIGHKHTFEAAWQSNDTHHWKNATCSHTDIKDQYSTHSDEDVNGSCDVCQGHVHSVNGAGYCKFADCGEKVKEVDETSLDELINAIFVQKHLVNGGTVDYRFNGISNTSSEYYVSKNDVISYTYGKDNYTHVFVENYILNGGIDTKISEADAGDNDPYVGDNFNWWIGDIDTNVKAVANIPFVGENGNWFIYTTDTKLSASDAVIPYIGDNGNWFIGNVDTEIGVTYFNNNPYVGINGTWVIGGTEDTGNFESWHQLLGADNVFGVVSENGGPIALDISDVGKLNGYYISLSTLAAEYGVEETLYALYQVAIADTTDELIVTPDANENKVTFKYFYKTVFVNENDIAVGDNVGSKVYNVNFFEVEVVFTYSDDYALTDLIISVDCYTNDPGTSQTDGFLYKDVDIKYDPETDEFIFIEYKQVLVDSGETDSEGNPIMEYVWEAVPVEKGTPDTYTITVTQTVGERTEENPNPRTKFIPENFDLYLDIDEEGVLSNKFDGSTLEIDVRDIVNLYVGDCTPEGTSLHFAADLVTFKVFKDNVEVQSPEDYLNETVVAMFTFAGSQRSFFIIPKTDGAFRLEIYLMGEKTHEINLHVGVVDEEFIEIGDDQFAVKINDTYAWTNEVVFTATEAGTYYFNLPAGIGFVNADAYDAAQETPATDDDPVPYFDYNEFGKENGGSFSLTLEAGESIRFYVNGTKRGTVLIQFVLF